MTKEKDEYYVKNTHAYHSGSMRTIVGRWKMIKYLFEFLRDPASLDLEIQKLNNYEIKDNQWFQVKRGVFDEPIFTLITDGGGLKGTMDENGDLITKDYGKLTKKL